MQNKKSFIIFSMVLFLISSCGGGGSSKPDDEASDNPTISNEQLVLRIYKGVWKGFLTIYKEGSTNQKCKWDIRLDLTSNKVQDSDSGVLGQFGYPTYMGNATAELLMGDSSCKSDSTPVDWVAVCTTLSDKNEYCSGQVFRRVDNQDGRLFDHTDITDILDRAVLSNDKTKMQLPRYKRDEPKLLLTKT